MLALSLMDKPSMRHLSIRFGIGLIFTLTLLVFTSNNYLSLMNTEEFISPHLASCLQFILASPVILWSGWPLLQKAWHSLRKLSLDRYALMATSIGLAYGYSIIALIFPTLFPSTMTSNGEVSLYFDLAAIVTEIYLVEQMIEQWAWQQAERKLKLSTPTASDEPMQSDEPFPTTQKWVERLNLYFIPSIIALAGITFMMWKLIGPYPTTSYSLSSTLAVLMIASPSALLLATPLTLMIAIGQASSAGIFIKNAAALERMAKVDVLVIDKSSIIMLDKLTLQEVIAASGHNSDEILYLAASLENNSSHPLAKTIVTAANHKNIPLVLPTHFHEEDGLGVSGTIDNQFIAVGNLRLLHSLEIELSHHFAKISKNLQKKGETVLFVAAQHKVIGLISIYDPIKTTTLLALKTLNDDGIRVILATGDNSITASVFAKKLGINAIESEISTLQRVAVIKELKQEGFFVAIASDKPSNTAIFEEADLSIALSSHSLIAPQASISFSKPDLIHILHAKQLCKKVMLIIKQNIFFALAYNACFIPAAMGLFYLRTGLILDPLIAAVLMTSSVLLILMNSLRLRNLFKA